MSTILDGNFSCFKCNEDLKEEGILTIVAEKRTGTRGKMQLIPAEGDLFEMEHSALFEYEYEVVLDHLDFFCPHCDETINASEETNNLQKILYTDKLRNEYEIFFYRVRHDNCSYMLRKAEVEVKGKNLYSDHLKKLLYRKYGMQNTKLTPR